MASWFVYVGQAYYPWAETVEAETPEQAVAVAFEGRECTERVQVFPAEARAYFFNPHDDD